MPRSAIRGNAANIHSGAGGDRGNPAPSAAVVSGEGRARSFAAEGLGVAVGGRVLLADVDLDVAGGRVLGLIGHKDRKSTRLNSSHNNQSRIPSSG